MFPMDEENPFILHTKEELNAFKTSKYLDSVQTSSFSETITSSDLRSDATPLASSNGELNS